MESDRNSSNYSLPTNSSSFVYKFRPSHEKDKIKNKKTHQQIQQKNIIEEKMESVLKSSIDIGGRYKFNQSHGFMWDETSAYV